MTQAAIVKTYRHNLTTDHAYMMWEYINFSNKTGCDEITGAVVCDQSFYIHNEYTLANISNPKVAYVKCRFVIDYTGLLRLYDEPTSFTAASFSGCEFILLNDKRGFQDDAVVLNVSVQLYDDGHCCYTLYNKATLMIKTDDLKSSRTYTSYGAIDTKFQVQRSIMGIMDKLVAAKYTNRNYDNSRIIKYRNRTFEFAKTSVAIGLELEFPIDSTKITLDTRQWLPETDGSQIIGNLEAVSVPMSLSYVNSPKLEQNLGKLWKRLASQMPSNPIYYSDDSKSEGSGIHIHYSWDGEHLPISNMELWQAMHQLVVKRGGKDYLLNMGGKSIRMFNGYSRFQSPSESEYGNKYIYINCVSTNHVELRFGANHPDQCVVQDRIRAMTRLFTESVELALVSKTFEFAKLQIATKCAKV